MFSRILSVRVRLARMFSNERLSLSLARLFLAMTAALAQSCGNFSEVSGKDAVDQWKQTNKYKRYGN